MLSKGPPTANAMCKHSAFKTSLKGPLKETVMCKNSAFKRAPYRNCNVQVLCFHRGPQQQLQFEGNLLSKGPQQPLKCVSRPTLHLNFIEGALKKLQCVSTLLAKGSPTAIIM